MNREGALAYLNPRFDALMLAVARTVDDSVTGYLPSLDASFVRYIASEGVNTTVVDTVVPSEDVPGFTKLLDATTYDLLLPFYAIQVDVSVDAPLTTIKYSQQYRMLKELRDAAWVEAGDFGYVSNLNADGFVLTLTHNEPGNSSASREFG